MKRTTLAGLGHELHHVLSTLYSNVTVEISDDPRTDSHTLRASFTHKGSRFGISQNVHRMDFLYANNTDHLLEHLLRCLLEQAHAAVIDSVRTRYQSSPLRFV